MNNLSDVRIIDLKHSKWNETTSSPKKGVYDFSEKSYVNYADKGRRPDFFLTWERWEPSNGYREFNQSRVKYQASHVLVSEKQFWPEGVPPDGEGKYVFGDAVLIKYPLIVELKRRAEAREISMRGAKARLDRFKGEMKRGGSDISDAMIDEMLGDVG